MQTRMLFSLCCYSSRCCFCWLSHIIHHTSHITHHTSHITLLSDCCTVCLLSCGFVSFFVEHFPSHITHIPHITHHTFTYHISHTSHIHTVTHTHITHHTYTHYASRSVIHCLTTGNTPTSHLFAIRQTASVGVGCTSGTYGAHQWSVTLILSHTHIHTHTRTYIHTYTHAHTQPYNHTHARGYIYIISCFGGRWHLGFCWMCCFSFVAVCCVHLRCCDVWCVMCGVWCVMCDARCTVYGISVKRCSRCIKI